MDVYRWPEHADALVVDCQADLLSSLPTRFAIPLLPEEAGYSLGRLNPVLSLDGRHFVLVPQLAATLTRMELGDIVGSVIEHEYRVMAAIDFLLSGI